MCEKCNHKYGTDEHLNYWKKEWINRLNQTTNEEEWNLLSEKLKLTEFHIENRDEYVKWFNNHYEGMKEVDLILFYRLFPDDDAMPNEYIDFICEQSPLDYFNDKLDKL